MQLVKVGTLEFADGFTGPNMWISLPFLNTVRPFV